MRFLIVTMGTLGDVKPYMSLAKELQLHNQEVMIATSYNYCEFICDAGIDCIPMKLYKDEGRPPFFNTRLINAVRVSPEIREDFLLELWDTCRKAEADAIIYNPANYCCYYVAERLGLPSFGAFIQPHHTTSEFPHPFTTRGKSLGGIFNKLGFWAYSVLHWRYVRSSINQWRKKTLQLPALSYRDTLLRQMDRNDPRIIYGYSPSFVPKPADWRMKNTVITGYWFLEKKDFILPPDISLFLDSGSPPVFISVTYNLDKFKKEVLLRVLDLLEHRVVVHDVFEELPEIPVSEKVFVIKGPIPHEWLFKRVAVAVHHGGQGICMNCIRAGVPMIVIPIQGVNDTRFSGYLVSKAGIGIFLSGAHGSSQFPEKLATAIKKAMDSCDMKQNIMAMQEKVKTEKGLQNAVRFILDEVS